MTAVFPQQLSTITPWTPSSTHTAAQMGALVVGFLDTATTSFGRATHYNTREEQQTAELQSHQLLFKSERDLYMVFLTLPGITDRARQLGIRTLLGTARRGVRGLEW